MIPFTIPFLCAIGVPTGDGRLFHAIDVATLPMPFRVQFADDEAHLGAVPVGRIETITQNADGTFSATGAYDATPDGIRAARLAASETMTSCSVETDEFEAMITDDGMGLDILHARVRGATQLAIGAWDECKVVVDPADVDAAEAALAADPPAAGDAPVVVNITAAGAPAWAPPREWFDDPHLDGPTPLTITADGRVYGHLALWDACHIGYDGVCVNPPPSLVDYAHFNTGAVLCADGAQIACGSLTFGAGHADTKLSAKQALEHYDNTCTVGAYVRAGEDRWGPWLAGAVVPEATEQQLRALRASAPSGDWRWLGGNLELVAALCVNVPGFPVPRPSVVVAGGQCQALVAAAGPRSSLVEEVAELRQEIAHRDTAALDALEADEILAGLPAD